MGLEISEEFRPITPVRVVSAPRTCSPTSSTTDLGTKFGAHGSTDLGTKFGAHGSTTDLGTKFGTDGEEVGKEVNDLEEEEECCSSPRTPKSEAHILRSPLVCPPAPRKPRPSPKRKFFSPPPSPQGFFQVPVHELDSLFMVLMKCNSKKIIATAS